MQCLLQSELLKPATRRTQVRGVTLIETVIVLAVIGILTAVGLPSLHSTLSGSRATTVANRLLTDLSRARSEAIMRREVSVICPSQDGQACSIGADWSEGWLVFADANGDNRRSGAEPVLSVVGASDLGGMRVATTSGRSLVRFRSDGRNGGSNLTLNLCDGEKLARQVIVNVGGRSRIVKPDATSQPSASCQ